jgi:hypothetical protein
MVLEMRRNVDGDKIFIIQVAPLARPVLNSSLSSFISTKTGRPACSLARSIFPFPKSQSRSNAWDLCFDVMLHG